MAIKPIEIIPQSVTDKRKSYREQIRNDIQEAIDRRIPRFEFDGDYNWKYLAQYAREVADVIWRKTYRELILKKRPDNLRSIYFSTCPPYNLKNRYIKIHSYKQSDRNHVYCMIDFDAPENLTEGEIRSMLRMQEKRDIEVAQKEANKDLTVRLWDLGLSRNALNMLIGVDCFTMEDLSKMSRKEIVKIVGDGTPEMEEVTAIAGRFGVCFGEG